MSIDRRRDHVSARLIGFLGFGALIICIVSILIVKALILERNQNDLQLRLITAIKDGDPGRVASLLAGGADVNRRREYGARPTPLLVAVGGDDKYDSETPYVEPGENIPLVRTLIERGADVNAQDAGGWTPLMYASALNHLDTAALLLSYHANVNITNENHNSALLLAPSKGGMIELLVRNGAEVNIQSHLGGDTVLMHAAASGDDKLVRRLLAMKPDVFMRDRQGRTALDIAKRSQSSHPKTDSYRRLVHLLEVAQSAVQH